MLGATGATGAATATGGAGGANRWVIGGAKGIVTSGADGCAIRQVPTIVGILVAVAHHGLEAAVVMHHDFGALGTSQDASSGGGKQSQAVHTYRRKQWQEDSSSEDSRIIWQTQQLVGPISGKIEDS